MRKIIILDGTEAGNANLITWVIQLILSQSHIAITAPNETSIIEQLLDRGKNIIVILGNVPVGLSEWFKVVCRIGEVPILLVVTDPDKAADWADYASVTVFTCTSNTGPKVLPWSSFGAQLESAVRN
jgi:hypothetical protein